MWSRRTSLLLRADLRQQKMQRMFGFWAKMRFKWFAVLQRTALHFTEVSPDIKRMAHFGGCDKERTTSFVVSPVRNFSTASVIL